MTASWKEMIVIVTLIIGLLWIQDARADMLQDFNSEVVEYIQTKHKILPEDTKFKCVKGILYKNGRVQRCYTGNAQTCTTIFMTRGDYETGIINDLF